MTPRTVMDLVAAALNRAVSGVLAPYEGDVLVTEACCTACGNIIRAEWRLCPHCGTLREGPDAGIIAGS